MSRYKQAGRNNTHLGKRGLLDWQEPRLQERVLELEPQFLPRRSRHSHGHLRHAEHSLRAEALVNEAKQLISSAVFGPPHGLNLLTDTLGTGKLLAPNFLPLPYTMQLGPGKWCTPDESVPHHYSNVRTRNDPAQITRTQHTCAGGSARAADDPRDSRRDDGCAALVADARRELPRSAGAAPATAASVTGRRRLASLGTGDSTRASRRARSSASALGTVAQNRPPLPCVDVRLPRPDQSRLVDRLVRPAPGRTLPLSSCVRTCIKRERCTGAHESVL